MQFKYFWNKQNKRILQSTIDSSNFPFDFSKSHFIYTFIYVRFANTFRFLFTYFERKAENKF